MSSTSWSDTTCMQKASTMSCQAMMHLAKKEYDQNASVLAYQVDYPNCERLQQLADRGDEYKLLLNGGISRNLCFTHDPSMKAGPYFSQIENTRSESFEKWTRRKDIGKPYHSGATGVEPMNDLDSSYFGCYHSVPASTCVYNDGTKITQVACPTTCGVHPTPCPNPTM